MPARSSDHAISEVSLPNPKFASVNAITLQRSIGRIFGRCILGSPQLAIRTDFLCCKEHRVPVKSDMPRMPVEQNKRFRGKMTQEFFRDGLMLDNSSKEPYDLVTAGQKRLISPRFTCFCVPCLGSRLAERVSRSSSPRCSSAPQCLSSRQSLQ